MRIAIFGDSSVDKHQLIQCRQVSPHLPDDVFEDTWIDMLSREHEVQVFSQMSASNAWIDEQWRNHKDDFDIKIIKAGAWNKLHVNYPSNWPEVHANLLLGVGPQPGAFLSKYQTVDGQRSDLLHYISLSYNYNQNTDHMARHFNLLARDWSSDETTLVWTHLGHTQECKLLDEYTVYHLDGSSDIGDFQKGAREFFRSVIKKNPKAKDVVNKVDPMLLGHLYHRFPFHLPPEEHIKFYEHAMAFIKYGSDEVINIKKWGLWDRPHPLLDKIEEDILSKCN